MDYYCEECKKECSPERLDLSFDHEFGTEHRHVYVSDCCSADLYKYVCESCNGSGNIDGVVCVDCDGLGLEAKVDLTDEDFKNDDMLQYAEILFV